MFDLSETVFVGSDIYRRAAFGRNHPLAIPRVETVADLAADLGWLEGRWHPSPIASRDLLTRYHDATYVAALAKADSAGLVTADMRSAHGVGTMENPFFSGVFARAATSVGGSHEAARLALAGRIAFHPAGGTHHGRRDRASGFCFFNDPVFAVLGFLDAGLTRILYVDLDAHHGDGVEDAYAADPRVMTVSIHEEGRWPGTGALGDRREGRARNMPVPRGINDSEWRLLVDEAVVPIGRRFAPQAVVVTCGADPLKGDPLSTMDLSNVALWEAVEAAVSLAPRAVVLGGGGYNPWTLARCWTGLWGRLAGFDLPETLPEVSRARLAALDCDLVDDDEREPAWTTTLADPRNIGSVRPEIREIIATITAS
ncbi:MAG: acetoin utilization protein AcuC [Siculibacillus sp.]|nr:acetoin utilization protein AcuC [Siculibacillus sp.]